MKIKIFLSSLFLVCAFNTSSLFASDKLCGKTASLVIKANAEMVFQIVEKFKIETEHCDVPQGEKHANYILKLSDATNRVIYEKKFILEEFSHYEEIPKDQNGKIVNNKIAKKGAQRILKIPLNSTTEKAVKFTITSLNDGTKTNGGDFKW